MGCDYPSTAIYRHQCQSDFTSRNCALRCQSIRCAGILSCRLSPLSISFVYRLDLKQSFRDAFRPHSLVGVSRSALILCVVPLGYTGLARLFGQIKSLCQFCLVCSCPPIASTIWRDAWLQGDVSDGDCADYQPCRAVSAFIASLVLQDIAVIEPLPLFSGWP